MGKTPFLHGKGSNHLSLDSLGYLLRHSPSKMVSELYDLEGSGCCQNITASLEWL